MSDVENMTPFEALDHVKAIRAGYNECIGSLYKNVAVDQMQRFLEQCVDKWGQRFMDVVAYERDEEICGREWMREHSKNQSTRETIFGKGAST